MLCDFLQAIAALWSKKIAKYGEKWILFWLRRDLLTSYIDSTYLLTSCDFTRGANIFIWKFESKNP